MLSKRLLARRVERHDLRTLAEWADTGCGPATAPCPTPRPRPSCLVALLGMLAERGDDTPGARGDARPGRRRAVRAQARAGRGPARRARRLPHARPGRRGALRRQGGQPAPARARLLRPRRAPRASHRARPGRARPRGPRDLRLGVRGAAARERAAADLRPPGNHRGRGTGRGPLPQAALGPSPSRGSTPYRARATTGPPTTGPCAPTGWCAWPSRRSTGCCPCGPVTRCAATVARRGCSTRTPRLRRPVRRRRRRGLRRGGGGRARHARRRPATAWPGSASSPPRPRPRAGSPTPATASGSTPSSG